MRFAAGGDISVGRQVTWLHVDLSVGNKLPK